MRPARADPTISEASTLSAVLRQQAKLQPEKRAFLLLDNGERESRSLTYAALESRAILLACDLHRRGLAGRRVILAYPTCLEFVVAVFGCFLAGVTAVPAPIAQRGNAFARVRAILSDAQATAILSLAALLDEANGQPDTFATVQGSLPLCIATDAMDEAPLQTLPSIDPAAIALLQYTSGSTGDPRGVMLTHANLMHNQRVLASVLRAGPEDSAVCWLPLYHDMGLIGAVLHSAYVGGSCVLMPPLSFLQRPLRWLNAISRYRATIGMAPCFAYDLCAQRGASPEAGLDLSRWRVAICGGEVVRPQALARFAAAFRDSGFDSHALLPAYGLAEATLLGTSPPSGQGATTVELGGSATHRQFVSCGTAWEGQRIAIVDPSSLQRAPEGQPGEIWLQGASVAAGYWNAPEDTASTFGARIAGEPNGGSWLRTGDLGLVTTDGLVVTGRRKELIVVRGANFSPGDIEMAARASDPALASSEGGAFSIEGAQGEAVVLVHEIGRTALKTLDPNRVAANVVEAVSRSFGLTLHDLVLLRPGALPRTTSGKVQRHVCRERYLAGELAAAAIVDHPALGRLRPRSGVVA